MAPSANGADSVVKRGLGKDTARPTTQYGGSVQRQDPGKGEPFPGDVCAIRCDTDGHGLTFGRTALWHYRMMLMTSESICCAVVTTRVFAE